MPSSHLIITRTQQEPDLSVSTGWHCCDLKVKVTGINRLSSKINYHHTEFDTDHQIPVTWTATETRKIANIKGEANQRGKMAGKCWKYASIFICRLHLVVLSIFTGTVFLQNWAPQGSARLLGSLPMKSRTGCGSWHVTDMLLTTCAGLVYTTDTDWWAHDGSIHSCVFMDTSHGLLFYLIWFNSIPTDRAHDTSSS